jgi:hypothetical protein
MSAESPVNRRRSLARLALYLGGVFGLPLLRRNPAPPAAHGAADEEDAEHKPGPEQDLLGTTKVAYAQAPLKALLRERPEFVFVGDSMVRAHIDAAELTKLSGRKVSALWLPNSTSARWYLMLKNYIVRSEVKPKRVVFCFRNCLWHMPTFRVDGPLWDDIERCMPDESDPVIAQVLGPATRRERGLIGPWLRDVAYRLQHSGEGTRQAVLKDAARLSGDDLKEVQKLANRRFNFQNYRHGITLEESFEGINEVVPFTADPAKSFLPHVIELAEAEGMSLYFVRIKRRPTADGASHDSPMLDAYMEAFTQYVTEHGHGFYDFSDDPELKEKMYAEGDHLADEHTAWFSRHLFEKIGKEVFA